MVSASGRRNCSLQKLLAAGFPYLASLHASPWSGGFGGKVSDNHLASFITLIKRAGETFLHIIIYIWASTGQSNPSRKEGREHTVGPTAFGESSPRRWNGGGKILPMCLGKLWPAPSLFAFLLGKFNFTSLIYSVIVKWSWWKDDLNLIFNLLVWTDKWLSCNTLLYRTVTFSPNLSESQTEPLRNQNAPKFTSSAENKGSGSLSQAKRLLTLRVCLTLTSYSFLLKPMGWLVELKDVLGWCKGCWFWFQISTHLAYFHITNFLTLQALQCIGTEVSWLSFAACLDHPGDEKKSRVWKDRATLAK